MTCFFFNPLGKTLRGFARCCLYFTLAVTGSAQALAADQGSSFGHAMAAVLERSLASYPLVAVRQAESKASIQELSAAEWGRFPSLSALARREDRADVADRSMQMSLPVWAGGGIQGRIDVARARREVSQADLLSSQQSVLGDAGQLLIEYLRLDYALRAALENEQEHERLMALIERRVAAEFSPASDLVIAQSRLQQAKAERIQLSRQTNAVKSNIEEFVGVRLEDVVGPIQPGWINDIVKQSVPVGGESSETVSWLERVLQFSPELIVSRQRQTQAQAEISVVRSQAMPRLSLGYEHSWRSRDGQDLESGVGFLLIQVDTGAGLSAVESVRAAESRRIAAMESTSLAERQLTSQVQILLAEIDSLGDELLPARVAFESAVSTVSSTLRQYQIGRKGWLDVLNAQREKTQAQFALATVAFGLEKSRFRLRVLAGEIRANNLSELMRP